VSRRLPFVAELALLILAALVAAAVSNGIGPRERRLAWVRDYPDALTVPKKTAPALAPARVSPPASLPAAQPPKSGAGEAVSAAAPPEKAAAPHAAPPAPVREKAAPVPKKTAETPAPASPAPSGRDFTPHPDKPWVEIAPEEARALFDRGALFIDARRTSVYRDGHIARARSMAVWEADADDKVKAFYEEGHDSKAPIVVYCSGGDCEDSHQLAQKLYGAGFDAVFVYKDGFPDWQRRGWPVEKGEGK
jgi:rhodanese-related sulfurtransferase